MYCIANICYVCLEKKNKSISNINSSLSVYKDIIHIIGYLPFNLAWLKTEQIILICEGCCLRLRETYQFQEMCLRNSALLKSYKDKLKSISRSNTENEEELTVTLDLNSKHKDTNEVKCEIKLENEEMCRDASGPIIEKSEDVCANVDDSFVKEEDTSKWAVNTWKWEEVNVKEDHPMDNNFAASINNESNSEISVYSNAHITNTDSVSSEFTCKQEHATNMKELDAAAKKSHTCSICSKSFSRKTLLTMHTRIHTHEKPYECSTCKKTFSRRWNLVLHTRIHTGAKPYTCSRCNTSFSQSCSLASHMRIHTGEKPFECSVCKKSFRQHVTLARHLRIHTGKKSDE